MALKMRNGRTALASLSARTRGNRDVTPNAGNLRRLKAGGSQDWLPHNFAESLTVAALIRLAFGIYSQSRREV